MTPVKIPFSESLRQKILHWTAQFEWAAFLDSCNSGTGRYGSYDFIAGVRHSNQMAKGHTIFASELQNIWNKPVWKFGIFSYEYRRNKYPELSAAKIQTRQKPFINFPVLSFFEAEVVILKERNSDDVLIFSMHPEETIRQIEKTETPQPEIRNFSGFQSDFEKENYLEAVEKLRQHIREGDCYEINLCRHLSANGKIINPAGLFQKLCEKSPAPFAGFAKMNGICVLSASPERFLRKQGNELLTQPIKGTVARGKNEQEDELQIHQLRNSQKEQAENVMIVDLSRNDFNQNCEIGSVQVPHLFEVQTFRQVHHLVSTITGKLKNGVNGLEAFSKIFPPGSMTGAPKIRVCELIDEVEKSARGIYSGSLGYVSPDGDFDFNVIIRSLIYNPKEERLSFHSGGAITWDSDPLKEWEETRLKASALAELIEGLG